MQRARTGRWCSSEPPKATITITNLGEQGVEEVFGFVCPPQAALVGFGKVVECPWAENRMIDARPVITTTLSADHRVSDGHRGGLFLSTLDRLLQEPEK